MRWLCGKWIDPTSASPYSHVVYNDKNEIIYVECVHGYVIIDKNFFEGEKND